MHRAVISLISVAAFIAAAPGKPRTEEADDSMVLAFFEAVLAPQKGLPVADRAACLAIGNNPGHHDPEEHIFKVLRKHYAWVHLVSRCDKRAAVLSVGPFWRKGKHIFGFAGVESTVGRCVYEATPLAPGLWRLEGQPCLLE